MWYFCFVLIYLRFYLKDKVTDRGNRPFICSFTPQMVPILEPGQLKIRTQVFLPGLPHGCRGQKELGLSLLLTQVIISESDWK